LQKLCDVLGDTNDGLTGSEIGRYLRRTGIDDPTPADTKRYRLFTALDARQRQDRCANNVLAFVAAVMAPVNYVGSPRLFEDRRAAVNEALAFSGLSIGPDGQLSTRTVAKTLSQAEQRASPSFLASSVKVGLTRANGVLPKVQRASRPEDSCRHPAWPSTGRAVG
jgi:hypothetical protein